MDTLVSILLPVVIVCYSMALAIESRRQFAPGRLGVGWTLVPLGVGWLLHTGFVMLEILLALPETTPVASWHHWWLMLAWGVALASGLWILWRPKTVAGLFVLLPLLALVLIAWQLPRDVAFPERTTYRVWIALHGICLLLGTGGVLLGSAAGVMYLLQSWQLRRKRPSEWRMQLPNLEWLQRVNERSLLLSSLLVMAGLCVGILSNVHLRQKDAVGVPWSDPVVWTSGVLLVWLVVVDLFSLLYKPARQGRKVAYLTLASFAFLGLVLAMLLLAETRHARPATASLRSPPQLLVPECV